MLFALLALVSSHDYDYIGQEDNWAGAYIDVDARAGEAHAYVDAGPRYAYVDAAEEPQRADAEPGYKYVDAQQNMFMDDANDEYKYVAQEARYLDPGYRPVY